MLMGNELDVSNLDKSLQELEKIINELESSDLGFGETLARFERGATLYQDCQKLLHLVEKKIKLIGDKLEERDFIEE